MVTKLASMLGHGRAKAIAALAAMMLCLAGCGGGGGGGGDGSSTLSSVTVSAPQVTPLNALNTDVLSGSALPTLVLTGTVSGDLGALNGRTVYMIVEDTAGLFTATPSVDLRIVGAVAQYTLTLQGQTLTATGRRQGNVRVFVCLDLQCNTRLAGTPLSIPFDFNVEAGLTLSQIDFNISVPFGTVPGDQTVTVTLSSHSSSWSATDLTPFNPAVPNPLTIVGANQPQSGNQLTFRLGAAAPGSYVGRIGLRTTATIGNQTLDINESINVNYTVTASPVSHVFDPPSLSLTRVYGNPLIQEHGYQLITNTGYTQTGLGMEFDPPPAPVPGPFDNWWNDNLRQSYSCIGTIGGGGVTNYDCLPQGTYTARVRYRIDGPSGFSSVVAFPITLNVVN